MVLVFIDGWASAGERRKDIDFSKAAVVLPFESSLAAASSVIPEMAQKEAIRFLKETALFSTVLTPEEAQNRDPSTMIEITGKLEDFSTGRTGWRLFFPVNKPAYVEFEITLKDPATGTILWERRISAEASSLSSRSSLSEPVEKAVKIFVKELQAKKKPEEYPLVHLYGFSGSMSNPSMKFFPQLGGGAEVKIGKGLSLHGEISTFLNKNNEFMDTKGSDGGVRFSIGPGYHFARCCDNKLDPFLIGGISARGFYGGAGMDWSHGVDRMYYFGAGINYWFSARYGMKLAVVDHIWPANGTSLHFMDVRAGVNFGFW
jgi:hypothetical protein